eukprot:1137061-Pelagomonas_calceolata.AAC.1
MTFSASLPWTPTSRTPLGVAASTTRVAAERAAAAARAVWPPAEASAASAGHSTDSRNATSGGDT